MYDPDTVAWEIRYPWWRRSKFDGRRFHDAFITIWHRDPKGDRGHACGKPDPRRLWRFHVHHWWFQVHPWRHFRRWAFERCEHCGRRAPWGYVPTSHGKGWVHHECDMAIHYERRCADLETMFRSAFAGYCRTVDMEPGEAVDILLPFRNAPRGEWDAAWFRNYTARGVLGLLEQPNGRE